MADHSLDQILPLINQHFTFSEHLSEELRKAEALAQNALTDSFLESKKVIRFHYLSTLSDLIHEVRVCHEQILSHLQMIVNKMKS